MNGGGDGGGCPQCGDGGDWSVYLDIGLSKLQRVLVEY